MRTPFHNQGSGMSPIAAWRRVDGGRRDLPAFPRSPEPWGSAPRFGPLAPGRPLSYRNGEAKGSENTYRSLRRWRQRAEVDAKPVDTVDTVGAGVRDLVEVKPDLLLSSRGELHR